MDINRIRQVLRDTTDTEPLYVAFMTLLDVSYKEEVERALAPNKSPDDRSYDAGRACVLKEILEDVVEMRRRD